jgi:multiple sugar transport system ATP-binding protein
MVLVGPSGCGKTTTLRIIAGLETATSGEVAIGDKLVNDVSPKDRDIAMVFQSYALYPHMNVYDNMAFGLKLRKYSNEKIEKKVDEVAELLGIKHLLRRKPGELSGGQRQRVAMGRAIVREPKVFLMDEPLSNLDAKLRVQMRAELIKLHRRIGVTTVYVTHDQMEAMTLGQRIVLMKDGLIQQIDTPLGIYEKPANKFVAGFVGSPSMNFFNVTVIKDQATQKVMLRSDGFIVEVPESKLPGLLPYMDKEVYFGIRPENIYDHMFARGATSGNTVRGIVEVYESVGSEVYLYVKIDSKTMIARVDAHTKANIGQQLDLVFDMDKMQIFDKETERSIYFS